MAAVQNQFLTKYNAIRNGLAAKVSDPNLRAQTLARFDADPRVQSLRKAAGLAPVSTAQGDVQQVAKQSLNDRIRNYVGDAAQGASAGLSHIGLAGIPEMLAAAGEKFLPSALTGNNTNASYSNILQTIQNADRQKIADHPVASAVGAIGGGVLGGNLVSRGVSRLAASSVPAVARAAQAVQSVGTFNKGQKLTNALKLATIGGAAGGTQAAGGGEDIPTGIATGAVAAPVAAGAAKFAGPALMRAGQVLSAPFTDVLKLPNASRVLGKITNATTDQMRAELAKIKAANPNANPTLFEVLPLADRNRIMNQAASKSDDVAEQAGTAISARAKQLAPEMQAHVDQTLQPSRDVIRTQISTDLANARGGKLASGDDALIDKAMQSTTDMNTLRDTEATAIMDPVRNKPITDKLSDFYPTTTTSDGKIIDLNPDITSAIRTAAGPISLRQNQPITGGDITNILLNLKRFSNAADPAIASNAKTALGHVEGVVGDIAPDVATQIGKMNDAYAARSRMLEGMDFGNDNTLRDSAQKTGTSNSQAQKVTNAFDTPEGQAGLALGQGNALKTNLRSGPGPALRLTNDIAGTNNDISRELSQNLGPDAPPIIDAAKNTAQSGQVLGSALNQIRKGGDDTASPLQTLTQVAAALHPTSFAATKAGAVKKLMSLGGIPENRASTIVDMVFSQNPQMQARAVNALGSEGTSKFVKYLAGVTGQNAAGNLAPSNEPLVATPASTAEVPAAPAQPDYSKMSDADVLKAAGQSPAASTSAQPDYSKMSDADVLAAAHGQVPASVSPYTPVLQQKYANENPDLVNLIQRQKMQESRGDPSAVSKKGAVGVLQVMPSTAPEAAKLAGVPWDPKAYKTDASYQEILGYGFMSNLLQKYGGDVSKALAAYNAGPGAVDKAVSTNPDNWLASLPAETQDYVQKVGA